MATFSFFFLVFFFVRQFLSFVVFCVESLSQNFFDMTSTIYFSKTNLGLFDQIHSKGAQSQLNHCSIVQNFDGCGLIWHYVLKMSHQHHVSCKIKSISHCMIINVAKSGFQFQFFIAMFVDEQNQFFNA